MTSKPGLFETFLCVRRRAPFLDFHLMRLKGSARRLHIPVEAGLAAEVSRRVEALGSHPHRGRLEVSSAGEVRLTFAGYDARLIFRKTPIAEKLISLAAPRGYPGAWAGMKTFPRMLLDQAHAEAGRRGAADAVLARRWVYETAQGNLFWLRGDVLHTPAVGLGCLPGILRGWVIGEARRLGVKVREGRFSPSSLTGAESIFRTNALIGIRWVREIAGLGRWRRPVHPLVMELYRRWCDKIRS